MAFLDTLLRIVVLATACMLPNLARAAEPPSSPRTSADLELAHELDAHEPHAPPPSLEWHSAGVYTVMGVAPTSTLYFDGFNPALRYDFELGMHWVRRKTAIFVGADGRVLQYFGRKAPGGGLDGVLTVSQGPVYGRIGAGVVTGVPGTRDVRDALPAMGGLAGIGLQGRAGGVVGRIGIDYDVRLDTSGRVNQSVMLTLRLVFGF
jgi:hypothetical protein